MRINSSSAGNETKLEHKHEEGKTTMRETRRNGLFMDLSHYRSSDRAVRDGSAGERWLETALWVGRVSELSAMVAFYAPEPGSLVRRLAERHNFEAFAIGSGPLPVGRCALETSMLDHVFDHCLRYRLSHVTLVGSETCFHALTRRLRKCGLDVTVVPEQVVIRRVVLQPVACGTAVSA